jgi:hypothetical protein
MLDFDTFNNATLDERQIAIEEDGDFVLKQEFDDQMIRLYTYNGFFIECIYSNTLDILKDIKAIEMLAAAEKYISLEDKLEE